MSSTFSPNRLYNLQATGDNNGTWGVVANSVFSVIDLNFGGRLAVNAAGSSNVTITATQARNVFHGITGLLTGNIDYILPAEGMTYLLSNGTTGAFTITAKCAGGTGIVIPQGTTMAVFVNPDTLALTKSCNYSTNIFSSTSSTGGSGNAQTITVDSNFTLAVGNVVICKLGFSNSGAMTLAVNGGSAKSVTDVKTNALASGAAVSGQVAIFAYDGTQFQLLNPALLPVTAGGTGLATLTANNVILGNGTSTVAFVAPSTSGNVLMSNGTTWTSASITATILAAVYPVGSYYLNETDNTNPATLFGFGTWTAVTDKFIVAHGSTYTSTGGAATVSLSTSNLPSSIPIVMPSGDVSNAGTTLVCGAAGGTPHNVSVTATITGGTSAAFSIIPTYQAAYIWKRTV